MVVTMQPVLDIFTLVIFLGVVQGVLLCFFFLARGGTYTTSNRYLGLSLLALSAIIFEVLLGYSGHITKFIHLIDFAEPMNFVIGPLAYLAIVARLRRPDGFRRHDLWHLALFAFWFLYLIPFYVQNADVKYNAWLDAWRPGAPHIAASMRIFDSTDMLGIRRYVNELTIVHVLGYTIAGIVAVSKAFRRSGLPFWSGDLPELVWLRTYVLRYLFVVIGVIFVKATFERDLGDYAIATFITLIIYAVSFSVIGRSSLFAEGPLDRSRKYEKSALTPEMQAGVRERLDRVMSAEKAYLSADLSMPELAGQVGVSPHHLSQVLNDTLGETFHAYVARHRIGEAMRLLAGPEGAELRIEDLAERVGYYSKSSFNTAFKKIAGTTPSQYRDSKSEQ